MVDRARESDRAQEELNTLLDSVPPSGSEPTAEQQQRITELTQTIEANPDLANGWHRPPPRHRIRRCCIRQRHGGSMQSTRKLPRVWYRR